MTLTTGDDVMVEMGQFLDVPFTPIKAEMTSPPTFSLGNKAAMTFRLWAEVDGRNLSIDIIEVMAFNEDGKVIEQLAYWSADNVTIQDCPRTVPATGRPSVPDPTQPRWPARTARPRPAPGAQRMTLHLPKGLPSAG